MCKNTILLNLPASPPLGAQPGDPIQSGLGSDVPSPPQVCNEVRVPWEIEPEVVVFPPGE